jgi:hypothetical protein
VTENETQTTASVGEVAAALGLTRNAVRGRIESGWIKGAYRDELGTWRIPWPQPTPPKRVKDRPWVTT